LIAVVNVGKPDERRDETQTKDNQKRGKPEIGFVFCFEKSNEKQCGENRALQNADKNDETARIKKIQFQPLDEKKINHR
jgi:hypothetical protein